MGLQQRGGNIIRRRVSPWRGAYLPKPTRAMSSSGFWQPCSRATASHCSSVTFLRERPRRRASFSSRRRPSSTACWRWWERGLAGQDHDAGFGGEGVDLFGVEVHLEGGEELAGVLHLAGPLDEVAKPGEGLLVFRGDGVAVLVAPVGGDALLGDAVHLLGAELDFEGGAGGVDGGGGERPGGVGKGPGE